MTAYIITQVDVHDPETFERYRDQAPAVLDKFGGRFLVRGGAMEVLEGAWPHPRGVLIRFPDVDTAKRWHASAEYGAIKPLRQTSASANMVVVEGVDGAEAPGASAGGDGGAKAGYVIVQVGVNDPEKFEEYRPQVPATLEPFGGRFLVRGGGLEVLEGEWAHPRCVVIGFPDVESARGWWASPAYEAPKALRQSAAATNMIVVEGV